MKKRTLTLLELFFCIAILALVGSFLIFKTQPMIAQYQFEGSVHRLVKELEWSHKIAMSGSADIDFYIKKKGKNLICQRMTDEPLGFKGGNDHFKIENIPYFFFDGEAVKELKLTFTCSGWIFPEGKIKLESSGRVLMISLVSGENRCIIAKEA